jgi:regulatory protein
MLLIKKIEILKREPSKVRLFLEDNIYLVSINTIAKFALYEGKELEDNELAEIVSDGLYSDLLERTSNYITYSPRTEKQARQYIHKYLVKIKVAELNIKYDEIVEEVVQKLKEFKYINDYEYAKLFVKSRLDNKPRSKFVLKGELFSKGIDKETAENVLEELFPDSIEVLTNLYQKKFGDAPITFDDKKKISFLQRKGFSWDDISTFVNKKNEL